MIPGFGRTAQAKDLLQKVIRGNEWLSSKQNDGTTLICSDLSVLKAVD